MSRRNAREKLCVKPSKNRYYTEEEVIAAGRDAEAVNALMRRAHVPLYFYFCPCRTYHLTHHPYGDGRPNRRVNP